MPTTTIKSNTVIEYDNILKVAQQARDAAFELPEVKTTVTYRRFYSLTTGNLSGDLNKFDSPTEFTIDAMVFVLLINDRIVQQGEMNPGDIEVFLKPYLNQESDGTIISEAFEPQIEDEIVFNNIRYKIKLIRTERIGNTKVMIDCLCSRLENDNPTVSYNDNYRAEVDGGRRGSGWS